MIRAVPDYSEELEQIIAGFPNDAAILSQAACCLYAAGRYSRALEVLGDAINLRPHSQELLWQRASYRRQLNMQRKAVEDLLLLLDSRALPQELASVSEEDLEGLLQMIELSDWRFDLPPELSEEETGISTVTDYSDPLIELPGIDSFLASAVQQLRQLSPKDYEAARGKPAIVSLSAEARALLFAECPPDRSRIDLTPLIQKRRWEEAVALLEPYLKQLDWWPVEDSVCLFLAKWGLGDEDDLRKCGEKIKDHLLHSKFRMRYRRNEVSTMQIVAVACWKAGKVRMANTLLDRIDERERPSESRSIFSYWRFHNVSWGQLKNDNTEVRQLIRGIDVTPPVLKERLTNR